MYSLQVFTAVLYISPWKQASPIMFSGPYFLDGTYRITALVPTGSIASGFQLVRSTPGDPLEGVMCQRYFMLGLAHACLEGSEVQCTYAKVAHVHCPQNDPRKGEAVLPLALLEGSEVLHAHATLMHTCYTSDPFLTYWKPHVVYICKLCACTVHLKSQQP